LEERVELVFGSEAEFEGIHEGDEALHRIEVSISISISISIDIGMRRRRTTMARGCWRSGSAEGSEKDTKRWEATDEKERGGIIGHDETYLSGFGNPFASLRSRLARVLDGGGYADLDAMQSSRVIHLNHITSTSERRNRLYENGWTYPISSHETLYARHIVAHESEHGLVLAQQPRARRGIPLLLSHQRLAY
jgi:hypothetical protein